MFVSCWQSGIEIKCCCLFQAAAYRPTEVDDATQTSPMTPTDNGDDSGSSYSQDEDDAKEALSPSDYDDLDDDEEKDPEDFRRLWEEAAGDERPPSGSGSSGSDGHKSESPPPYSNKPPSRASSNGSRSSAGSGSGSSSSGESSRAKRLKDLDEIMRQIDEQAKRLVEARERESQEREAAHSPPPASSSPKPQSARTRDKRNTQCVAAGGRDRSSDTEADRLLPRGGFYKQTDAETGQVERVPVTSPKSEVMYTPNVKPSKQKPYSPLQIHIPNKNKPQARKTPSPPKSLNTGGKQEGAQPVPSKRELYSAKRLSSGGAKSKNSGAEEQVESPTSPTSPLSPMSDSKRIPEMPQITPRRVGQNPAFNKSNYRLYQNLPPPVSPRKTLLTGKREKSPLSRIDHEKLLARSSPLSSASSSDNSELFSRTPGAASAPRKNTQQQQQQSPNNSADTLTAVPYRGVKTGDGFGCSPPPSPRRKGLLDQSLGSSSVSSVGHSPAQRRFQKTTPEPPPRNLAISGNKLTHPLLDGYPFRRNSLSADGAQSTSEGYHSDRADPDLDAIVIREIPIKKELREGPVSPNQRQSYHEATSPDYVDL